jgi:hypothetical protein
MSSLLKNVSLYHIILAIASIIARVQCSYASSTIVEVLSNETCIMISASSLET